jgi:hypothetical protein
MASISINRRVLTMVMILLMVILLLVAAAFVIAAVILETGNLYCGPFETTHVNANAIKYHGTSLYPFSGNWNSSAVGKTEAECLSLCQADSTCLGFYRHNENDRQVQQGTCRFYQRNNVVNMLGNGVGLSDFFTHTTTLVLGDEQPETRTDTYIKHSTDYNVFRSSYDGAAIALP